MSYPANVDFAVSTLGSIATSVTALAGGFSHETWLVNCSDNSRVIVRLGGKNASVETAVLSLARSTVPVPQVLSHGDGFVVLEFIEGQTLEEVLQCDADPHSLNKLAGKLGRVVASIGTLEFQRPGFFKSKDLLPGREEPWSEQITKFCEAQLASSSRFSAVDKRYWIDLCKENASVLQSADSMGRLVHSDLNPKNIIIHRTDEDLEIAAIIDWEFAYSGCPFADAGNFCRFREDYPPGFLEAFVEGFESQASYLTEQWQLQARVLDMFALCELATKPKGHPIGDKAEVVIRSWIAGGIPPLVT
ncbi:phosphotransferase [Roseibium algicola]|uniref:phosphotransferase family protein n=1 Tax=Roseibium algicola TaxID=2857014 RepID=UPI00345A4F9D